MVFADLLAQPPIPHTLPYKEGLKLTQSSLLTLVPGCLTHLCHARWSATNGGQAGSGQLPYCPPLTAHRDGGAHLAGAVPHTIGLSIELPLLHSLPIKTGGPATNVHTPRTGIVGSTIATPCRGPSVVWTRTHDTVTSCPYRGLSHISEFVCL